MAQVVAQFAPWWGFAFYSIIYLGLGVLAGGMLGLGLADAVTHSRDSVPGMVIGAAVGAAIAGYLIVGWIRRRRGGFRRLAAEGVVRPVYIGWLGSTAMASGLVRAASTGVTIWVTLDGINYRALVRGSRPWAQPGVPIGVIAIPGLSYALFLAPDDELLLARESMP